MANHGTDIMVADEFLSTSDSTDKRDQHTLSGTMSSHPGSAFTVQRAISTSFRRETVIARGEFVLGLRAGER